jgi:phthiodiolone/phenolphthiodiolone dimycocerosates ketoreductase
MVETAVMLFGDRNLPIDGFADQVRALEASGCVDHVQMADQLSNFLPPSLWTKENTPLAEMLRDADSMPDAFAMGSYAMAVASSLKLTISTDSIRRLPAELIQTMLTLQTIAKGNAMFHIGSGEAKQTKPFGHKRSQGLGRLEDIFRLARLFYESDGPVDFEGNHSKMSQAYLGCAKPEVRPKIWGLGGGPKLIDLSTSYGDGLTAVTPCVWARPEDAENQILAVKEQLEKKGRDPQAFGFGMWVLVLLHEDQEYLSRTLDNPLVRWMAATYGRISPQDWRREGLEPAVPDGWAYYSHLVPQSTSAEFADEVVAKTSREMAEKSFLYGTAEEVSESLRPYIDAGVSWICPVDYVGLLGTVEESAQTFQRDLELCRLLKS